MNPREILVATARQLCMQDRDRLRELQARANDFEREDFVWHAILTAFSTWGSSRGWDGLINSPENYGRVTFDALTPQAPAARFEQAEAAFRAASMRMPAKKARLLCSNFDRIVEMGGVAAARKGLVDALGRTGKVRFMSQFDGIGPKYARNVMMDVHHGDFRESIAIDSRIEKVSKAAGESFDTYEEHERYLLGVAQDAGLSGWELDRLLYWNTDRFLDALRLGRAPLERERGLARIARDRVEDALDLLARGDVAAATALMTEAVEALGSLAEDPGTIRTARPGSR